MKILLFGDTMGMAQLLRHLPRHVVAGIVGASIRPQYVEELQALAIKLRIPFFLQPKWKSEGYDAFVDEVRVLSPDLIWVNSYSMILRDDLLSCSKLGGLNIHAAILPKNRGCNPTQWALIKGEHETGVTLHQIDGGIDTGPIIDQQRIPIFFEDSWMDVRQRLERATGALIIKNIPKILSESWSAVSQMDKDATVGKRRKPEDGRFSWSQPLVEIYNKARALLPPLPPAFYKNEAGKWCSIQAYHSIWQLTLLKHESCAGARVQSNHLRLRPLQKSDADLLYEWITDRELVIHNSPFFPVSETDYEVWVERMMKNRSDLVVFVIEDLASEQAIGTCQLLNINWIHRSAELQIRIGSPTFQGRGFGSEAISLLCAFGFMELNLHRIYLSVFKKNERAIRAYRKCGFVEEGVMRESAFIDGHWIDVTLMGLLNDQQ